MVCNLTHSLSIIHFNGRACASENACYKVNKILLISQKKKVICIVLQLLKLNMTIKTNSNRSLFTYHQ